MQWDATASAGFTTGTPWLPIADDYRSVNVETERDDPRSMLTLYRRLIAQRRAEPALAVGTYAPVRAGGDVLAYRRENGAQRFLVALNLGAEPRTLDLREIGITGRVALSTYLDRDGEHVAGSIRLRGDEGLIIEVG